MDGFVDFADIPPFIAVLISENFQAEADIDLSGRVNFADIPPFIGVLTSDAIPTNQIVDGSATCGCIWQPRPCINQSLKVGIVNSVFTPPCTTVCETSLFPSVFGDASNLLGGAEVRFDGCQILQPRFVVEQNSSLENQSAQECTGLANSHRFIGRPRFL